MLNMLNVSRDNVAHVIDDSPASLGHFIPGVGTEVVAGSDPRAQDASVVLITAPTHVEGILSKERGRISRG